MTEDEVARAVALRRGGWTFVRIGRELHYDPDTIGRTILRLLGPTRVPRAGRARAQQAAALRAQGWHWVRIAPHLGYKTAQAARSAARPYLAAEVADRRTHTWCSGCERWLSHTAFGRDSRRAMARAWQCKRCTAEARRIQRWRARQGEGAA